MNHYENCVLPITIFFLKLTHQARDCSAGQMFVSRQLPTCKMLIRRNVYGFMLNVQKSSNLILNNIVHCDILFTSPLWKHCMETAIVYTPVLVGNHIQTPHCDVFVLYNFYRHATISWGESVFLKQKSVSIRIIHQCIDVSRHFARESHQFAKKIPILRNTIKIYNFATVINSL